jgi:hypothetical protein
MVDDLDRAEIECEYELAEALRIRKPAGPQPTGYCHWCGDAVDVGMRWCDHSCLDEWQLAQERMAQNARFS